MVTLMDAVPLWLIFVLCVSGSILFAELGYRWYLHRNRNIDESGGAVGSIVASILGLLAFMLAFTFGVASSRFDDRRLLVVDEANAIGTAYLRADILEEPTRKEVKKILRDYAALRVESTKDLIRLPLFSEETANLQQRLWNQAATVGQNHPNLPAYSLFISAINDVIDIYSKRIAALLYARVPDSVWMALFSVAALSMTGTGFYCGMTRKRHLPELLTMALSFSTVLLIVVDLDRPWQGTIRVPQDPMIDLSTKLSVSK